MIVILDTVHIIIIKIITLDLSYAAYAEDKISLIAPGAAILVIGLILISAGVIIMVIVVAVYIQKRKK